MASFVKAADAVAAAVEIEKRGHAFYLQVAEKATNPTDKKFFQYMAEEENRHEQLFATMLKRLGGLELPAGSSDAEYLDYVQALLDSHTLFLPEAHERMLQSPIGAAIQLEKDTLLFFIALEEMVPAGERASVRACADEERRHIKLLTQHGKSGS
ncbi:ferritin-like domain-containing protein [Desulfovibrio cuneatus]|uniref:ferritin-like domain-containing protein n=1 Tax=Desulfovibrio cuneatus TaxID=159728 RepID=UPI0003F88FC2|nr:ferritin family protein [Desulfovibrio cuneatus]